MYTLTVNSQNMTPNDRQVYETLEGLKEGIRDTIKSYEDMPEDEQLAVYKKWENITGLTKKLIQSSKGYGITMGIFVNLDSLHDLGQALTVRYDETITAEDYE